MKIKFKARESSAPDSLFALRSKYPHQTKGFLTSRLNRFSFPSFALCGAGGEKTPLPFSSFGFSRAYLN